MFKSLVLVLLIIILNIFNEIKTKNTSIEKKLNFGPESKGQQLSLTIFI